MASRGVAPREVASRQANDRCCDQFRYNLEDADEEEGAEEEEETDSEAESSDLISQILPPLSGKGGSGGLNAGMLSSLLGGGGAGGLASLLGGVSGTMNSGSATNALSALSNNQLKTLLGQLKP